jgi:presenilin-like A22 family membrane protease
VRLHPFYWSGCILILCLAITFPVASQYKNFIEQQQISIPEVSIELPIIYLLGAVVVLGLVLFLIPVSRLALVFRILFVLLFAWGVFIVLGFSLPMIAVFVIAAGAAIFWFFRPRVWLHDLLLIIALAGMGTVFGFILVPWTALIFMVVISIYDILAVRFGYMLWMAKKLSQLETLPAFIIPRDMTGWNLNLKEVRLTEEEPSERDFSILGGGDIGFPLLVVVSVFFAYGVTRSLVLAVFSLLGLAAAYWIQAFFLKGKPMAALPPITFACLVGFLIVYFV